MDPDVYSIQFTAVGIVIPNQRIQDIIVIPNQQIRQLISLQIRVSHEIHPK